MCSDNQCLLVLALAFAFDLDDMFNQNPTTLTWKISMFDADVEDLNVQGVHHFANANSNEEIVQTSDEEQEVGCQDQNDQESPDGPDRNLPSFSPGEQTVTNQAVNQSTCQKVRQKSDSKTQKVR
jgi:hypothetical protein